MKLLFCLCLGVTLSACTSGPRTLGPRPPATRIEPVTETIHGVPVTDNYRWLEGDNSDPNPLTHGAVTPEVAKWTDAQNEYTRKVLDGLPGRKALEDRLRQLMEVTTVTAPIMRGNRYFFSRRKGSEKQPTIYWREGHGGQDHVLINPATMDDSGLTAVEWFSPSHDGKLVAYGTYRSGDENTTLHLMEVDSAKVLALQIPNKTQSPDWLPDGSGFVYQNLKNAKDPYSGQVLFHRMGTDPAKDPVLFRQFTKEENAKLATTWGPFGSLSRDGKWLLLGYYVDTKSNDAWLVNFDDFRKTGKIDKKVVSVGVPGQVLGTVVGDTLLLQTTQGAPKGRIVAASVSQPDAAHWRVLVPEHEDAVIQAVGFAKGVFAVSYLKNASNAIEVFDLSGRSRGLLNQPGIGTASVSVEEDRTEAYLTFASYNYPTTIFRVDLGGPAAPAELWEKPDVPIDPAAIDVEQVWYPSKDGTKISMFLVHKKGLAKTGDAPVLLTGYGGFNISYTPGFAATLFPWYEAGGVFAVPNLRGGGEYGDAWHEAGMLDKKQNVFDDFIAAAEWLIANKYTNPNRLAITGGSNGGLLTGAAVTQRPELFRAAAVLVPLLDMLRYQDYLKAQYWVPEYGTSANPEQFKYLLAYSPYHHVKAGTKYPAVFLTAGENDHRVHALHARKMAAALQEATASDQGERPILLWVDRDAGHGQGKPLDLRIRDAVDERIFEMWQLGMVK
jgi:prolyl oligopeptidase